MKLGLIGVGGIAQTYFQAIHDWPVARLVALADSRSGALQPAVEAIGCVGFEDYRDMARSGLCDAVIVCTPPATHAEICFDFLDNGVAVLCEKPLCLDVSTARRLRARSEDTGVLMTMASKFRYVADLVRTRSLIASGLVGEVIQVDNAFTSQVAMRSRWNSDPTISGGGVLIDNGSHSVDILRYLLGPILHVHAFEPQRLQPLCVEDTVELYTRSASGGVGRVELCWSLSKPLDDFVTVHGTEGVIQIGWQRSRYRLRTSPDWMEIGPGYQKVPAFRRMLENFIGALRGEEDLLITMDDAIASVEAIQLAYRSLANGSWVSVISSEPAYQPPHLSLIPDERATL
jgi:predicted dehydrogenase